jgi:hypothetical protein
MGVAVTLRVMQRIGEQKFAETEPQSLCPDDSRRSGNDEEGPKRTGRLRALRAMALPGPPAGAELKRIRRDRAMAKEDPCYLLLLRRPSGGRSFVQIPGLPCGGCYASAHLLGFHAVGPGRRIRRQRRAAGRATAALRRETAPPARQATRWAIPLAAAAGRPRAHRPRRPPRCRGGARTSSGRVRPGPIRPCLRQPILSRFRPRRPLIRRRTA